MRIDQVPVMGDGDGTALEIDDKRLCVLQFGCPGRGVAHVPDGDIAGQPRENVLDKDIGDQPHLLVEDYAFPVGRCDPRTLLPSVLERI